MYKLLFLIPWLAVSGIVVPPPAPNAPRVDVFWRHAVLKKVVDGDTFDLHVSRSWSGQISVDFNVRVRLAEADTPETRGEESADGKAVTRIVEEFFGRCEPTSESPMPIDVRSTATGNFGRPLVYLRCGGIELNEWLLQEGLARPYGVEWGGLPPKYQAMMRAEGESDASDLD